MSVLASTKPFLEFHKSSSYSIDAGRYSGCAMSTFTHLLRTNLRIHRRLRARACPTVLDRPLYRHCMNLARSQGLSKTEALQFTIDTRARYF